jgi:hypothetical protein
MPNFLKRGDLVGSSFGYFDDALFANGHSLDGKVFGQVPFEGSNRSPGFEVLPGNLWPGGFHEEPLAWTGFFPRVTA